MITLKDIAKRAGTSVAVVSKVLNGSKTTAAVREDIRERVLALAKRLGYHPHPIAQGLAKGRTFTIGIVFTYPPLAYLSNFMVSQVIYGIWDKARKMGYNIFLKAPKAQKAGFFPPIADLKGRVDGVIAMGPVRIDDREIEKWNDIDIPLVLLGTHPNYKGSKVDYDNEGGAFLATNYLLNKGHKRIAIIGVGLHYPFMQDRFNGYNKALKRKGLEVSTELVKLVGWRGREGYRACKELLALSSPPTAIFICVGEHIRGVYEAIKESGFRVPQDVELISFDRLPEDFLLGIPLLSLNTFPYTVGLRGTQLLLNIIEGKVHPPKSVRVSLQTIVSVGEKLWGR